MSQVDRILVVDEGKIVENGSYRELLQKGMSVLAIESDVVKGECSRS